MSNSEDLEYTISSKSEDMRHILNFLGRYTFHFSSFKRIYQIALINCHISYLYRRERELLNSVKDGGGRYKDITIIISKTAKYIYL